MKRSRGLYLRMTGKDHTRQVNFRSLPTHIKIKIGGIKKVLPVSYWEKDALSAGRYVHPLTGEQFTITRSKIDLLVNKFNRMKRAGIEIPTPVDHSDRAEDNRGFVISARRVGDHLRLTQQAIGSRSAVLAATNRCSVYLEPSFVDAHNKNWGEVIVHSAYTPKPVIHGQGEFIPIAASRAGTARTGKIPVLYLSKETRMPLTAKKKLALRKLLGIKKSEPLSLKGGAGELLAELALTQARKLRQVTKKPIKKERPSSQRRRSRDSGPDLLDEADDDEDDAAEEDEDDAGEDLDTEHDDDDVIDEADDEDDAAEEEDPDEDEEEADDDDNAEGSDRVQSRPRTGKQNHREPALLSRANVSDETHLLLSRAVETERREVISRRGVDPRTEQRIAKLFMPKGELTGLALSRVGKNPLYFRLLRILQGNKAIPTGNGRTGSQSLELSRTDVASRQTGGEDSMTKKETAALEAETRDWLKGRNPKTKDKD